MKIRHAGGEATPGNRERLQRGLRPRKTSDSDRCAGIERRASEAPEAHVRCRETPWELRISCRSAGCQAGQDPEAPAPAAWFARRQGRKRVRGIAEASAAATVRQLGAPKGCSRPGRSGVRRRTRTPARAQGYDQALRSARPRVPQSTRLSYDASDRLRRGYASRPRRSKRSRNTEPHEWQRSIRSHSGGGVNRRGREIRRGRNVLGEVSPGLADPVAHVAGGARNPRRGVGGYGLRPAVWMAP